MFAIAVQYRQVSAIVAAIVYLFVKNTKKGALQGVEEVYIDWLVAVSVV